MAVLDEQSQSQIKNVLGSMLNPVKVVMFTQEFECPTCRDTKDFIGEMCSLSDKIIFETKSFTEDKEYADKLGVDKIPAIILLDHKDTDHGIRFFGPPGGYEINSFIKALLEVSGRGEDLGKETEERINAIDKDVHIQVFISLGCPHCPGAVSKAHMLASKNSKIKADMVEGSVFPHIINKYNVSSVPKIVINETKELLGDVPLDMILKEIESL